MAIDSVWLGPIMTYQMGGTWLGSPAEPGAMAFGFAYDSATGDIARDPDGNAVHCAATVTATPADFLDATDLRERLVVEIAVQFAGAGVIPFNTPLTAVWTDYTPPPSP